MSTAFRNLHWRVVRRQCTFWPGHEHAWMISYWYRGEWHPCGYTASHTEAVALMYRNWSELQQGLWTPEGDVS